MTGPTDQLRLPLLRHVSEGDFVVTDSNRAAVLALSDWPRQAGDRMALCGPAGSGKSRLGRMWAERVGAVPLFGEEAALADPLELEGRPILLDDADRADDETLFHLINLTQSGGGALLMIARQAPGAWPVALPDLRSRLAATRAVAAEAPDDAVLAAMLNAAFAERSIAPGDGVIDYLVRRLDRTPDAARDVVARLDALHRPVTRVLARQVMDDANRGDDD